jgi:rhomboid-like protein
MFLSQLRCQAGLHTWKYSPKVPFGSRSFFQSNVQRYSLRASRSLRDKPATEPPRSFRDALKRSRPVETFSEKVGRPGIRNQILVRAMSTRFIWPSSDWVLCFQFAGVGSLLVFCYAASRTNIETEYWKKRLMDMSSVWTFQSIKSTDLKRAQNADLIRVSLAFFTVKWILLIAFCLAQYLREWFQSINSKLQDMPALIRPWVGLAFVSVLQPYADASEGKRLCWKICLLNAGVYLAWKIRKWRPAMNVRFMHNPLSGLSYTLLTSMFRLVPSCDY